MDRREIDTRTVAEALASSRLSAPGGGVVGLEAPGTAPGKSLPRSVRNAAFQQQSPIADNGTTSNLEKTMGTKWAGCSEETVRKQVAKKAVRLADIAAALDQITGEHGHLDACRWN